MSNEEEKILSVRFSDIWKKNVVLVSGLGLVPVIAVGTSIRNAAALSLLFCVLILGTYLVASLLPDKLPVYTRIPIYALISAVFFIPAYFGVAVLFPALRDMLSIYMYVAVMDMLVIYQAESFARQVSPIKAVLGGLINTLGFSVVLFLVGFIRELLTTGGLLGNSFITFKMLGASRPFFGFILVGLLCAGYNLAKDHLENPREKETRKAKRKHKTVVEEVVENREDNTADKEEIEAPKQVPAAFIQAKTEAKQKMQARSEEKVAESQSIPEVENDQKTIEVVLSELPSVGETEAGYRKREKELPLEENDETPENKE